MIDKFFDWVFGLVAGLDPALQAVFWRQFKVTSGVKIDEE